MFIILIIGLIASVTSFAAFFAAKDKSRILARPYKICEPMGSFVWADHVIFGPFWSIVSFVTYFLNDWKLFLLIFSAFWLIRSSGETMYWFFQQFYPRAGNEPSKFWINRYVPGEAVWFMHQIFWQCVTVFSLILTIYFSFLWITQLVV